MSDLPKVPLSPESYFSNYDVGSLSPPSSSDWTSIGFIDNYRIIIPTLSLASASYPNIRKQDLESNILQPCKNNERTREKRESMREVKHHSSCYPIILIRNVKGQKDKLEINEEYDHKLQYATAIHKAVMKLSYNALSTPL